MKKRSLLCLALALTLGTLACGKIIKKKGLPGPNDKVFDVSVAEVVSREIPDSTEFKGTFVPTEKLELKSDFAGKVQALSVIEGQVVAPGDALLKIDDEKLPYILDREKAELKEAEAQYDIDSRMAVGSGQGDEGQDTDGDQGEEPPPPVLPPQPPPPEVVQEEVPQEEGATPGPVPGLPTVPNVVENPVNEEEPAQGLSPMRRALALRQRQARRFGANGPVPAQSQPVGGELAENRMTLSQARIDRIKAEIALTEKQLAGSTISAPFEAFVSKIGVAEGSMVQVNDFLMTLVNLDPIELSMEIPKNQIDKIDKSLPFKVTIPDLNNENMPGEISFIGAELDAAKKGVEVRLRVANRGFRIKIGMEGVAQLAVANRFHSALLIPPAAVIYRENKKYVYLVKGQKAVLEEIETGGLFEGLIEVKSGLSKGEKIVAQGANLLKEEEEFIRLGR